MIHTIQTDTLRAEINSEGAELYSLFSKETNTEYIWQRDPAWWENCAPILFPIVCAMKDNEYTYGGKLYKMPKHGFVRQAAFSAGTIEEIEGGGQRIVFEYSDNEETLKMYPFKFNFQIIFEIRDNTLGTVYRVENRNDCTMYFSFGSHEAFRCPREDGESFDDYYLEFSRDDTYISECVDKKGIINGKTYTVIDEGRVIPLKHEMFANDALIFKNVPDHCISLKSKKSKAVVRVDYEDAPHLGIWTKVGAPYVCIEPWYGLPDFTEHNGKIEEKYGIITVEAGEAFAWRHTISIE